MKKLLLILSIFLIGFAGKYPKVEKIFQPTEKKVTKQIRERVKDHFGRTKATVIRRIDEKVYSETQILNFTEQVAREEVKKDFEENIEKIKTNWILLKNIPVEKISLKNIPIKEISAIILSLVDLSVPRKCKSLDSRKLTMALMQKDYKKVNEILKDWNIKQSKEIMTAITKTQPFWIEGVFGENVYFITEDREVQDGDVVIVDVTLLESRIKYAEFLHRNKGERYAIQLGYEALNNFEVRDISEYPNMTKEFTDFYFLAKSIDPDVTVGVTVCMTPTQKAWLDSLSFQPDVIFLWNISKMKAPFGKIKEKFFKDYDVVIAGMNVLKTEGNIPNPAEYIIKIRNAGFKGSIWYK